jgi:hypothetical protein
MTRQLFSICLVALGASLVATAHAQEKIERLPSVAAPTVGPDSSCAATEKTICTKKVYLIPEQCATTLPRMALREVEVCKEKRTILQLDWREEKFECTEMELKENTAEQEVTCLTVKEEKTTDPATGATCTVYKQVPETVRVKISTFELVPVQRQYVVRIPLLKSEERDVVVKKLEVDRSTIPAVATRYRAETIPCEMKLQLPNHR